MNTKEFKPQDKVRIKNDAALLYKNGLEVLRDTPDIFTKDFTIKYMSFGWATIEEEPLNQYDIHPDLLIKI